MSQALVESAPRRSQRAVIIGGSMSGLFAAAYLRQIGWDADVYERSSVPLVGRGAGITSHPELIAALESCGAGTDALGVEVEKRILLDASGRVIAEKPLRQLLTSWDRLQQLLQRNVPAARYHLGHELARLEQDGREVRAHFANGRVERADLLVGGDGIRSQVRALVAPEVQPIYAGYYIWRGAPHEADLGPEARRIFPYYAFYLPERQQVLGYPIAGLDNALEPGRRRYNFIWYRVGDAALLREMCVDENGRQHEHSVPPPLVRRALIAQMRAEAAAILPPALLDALTKIAQPFFTPVYDFNSPSLVYGRVALVGDAAGASRPHMGFGVSKAGDDARALAQALGEHDDVDAALARYDALRQPIGERIVRHGRRLGTHLGVGVETEEDRRMWALLQDPRAMMDWIAVPNFL
jgi:2-polyprenyl-6-methoxyphenol hydroxylase-like FAD-dependent oxidoreductase